jgi:hypothetical protein
LRTLSTDVELLSPVPTCGSTACLGKRFIYCVPGTIRCSKLVITK